MSKRQNFVIGNDLNHIICNFVKKQLQIKRLKVGIIIW